MNYILEIIENLQRFAADIEPVYLVILGVACILFGLFFWLAGLKLKRILIPLAAMGIAAFVCYYMLDSNIKVTAGVAGAAFVAAFVLQFILVCDSMFWNLPLSLFFSALGAALIFTGQILLLVFKGSSPYIAIYQKQQFFVLVFVAMVAFGAIVQVLFCTAGRKYLKSRPADNKDKSYPPTAG